MLAWSFQGLGRFLINWAGRLPVRYDSFAAFGSTAFSGPGRTKAQDLADSSHRCRRSVELSCSSSIDRGSGRKLIWRHSHARARFRLPPQTSKGKGRVHSGAGVEFVGRRLIGQNRTVPPRTRASWISAGSNVTPLRSFTPGWSACGSPDFSGCSQPKPQELPQTPEGSENRPGMNSWAASQERQPISTGSYLIWEA